MTVTERQNTENKKNQEEQQTAVKHIEDCEQMTLFEWACFQSGKYPELNLLFHIPNGGKRDAREAARFKRMGVKPGVPDLFLPVAKGGFNGLFIELKAKGGRLTDYQKKWLDELNKQGYAACVCFGFEEAQKGLIEYLSGKMQKSDFVIKCQNI